jgi:hypothetical protein
VVPSALVGYAERMRVSGHVLRARYVYAKSRGPEAYAQVLDALPEDLRAMLEDGILETRWYPYEILVQLTETIDRVLGNGDVSLAYDMGRFSCDQNLTTAMRLLFKFGNIGWLLDRVAKAWGKQFDEGQMLVVRRDVGTEVVLELLDHPHPNRAHCLAIKGWMVRATELSGEDAFECVEECRAAGDDVCRWSFRWLAAGGA